MTYTPDSMYGLIEENFRTDYKNLLRIANNKLGNLWAEDALMDTYEALLKAAPRLHGRYDIKYLMRAALFNRIKDYMSDRIDAEEIDEHHTFGGEVEDKWKALSTAENALKLIERYKEPMKTGLYLHLLEGVALRTVTEIVGVPFTTVRFHANKVREALQ